MNDVRTGPGRGDPVIREAERGETGPSSEDLFLLLRRLRPELTRELFHEVMSDGYDQGLRYLVARSRNGAPLAAAGYRVLSTSRGRVLHVDDLVTHEAARSRGVAAALLTELKELATAAGCVRLELDSGVTNTTAHRFYLRNRMDILAFHFAAVVDVGSDRTAPHDSLPYSQSR